MNRLKHRKIVGHPSRFEDGIYICKGSFGHNKPIADQMAESIAKRYQTKTRVTEKKVRVGVENGTEMKPLYLIWEKRK